jgi:DNA polymerase-3 subunit epsilon
VVSYVGFDLETTGVSSFRDAPVSFGFVEHVAAASATHTVSEGGFVHPGIAIPAGAIAVHGITDAMVRDATPLRDATELLAARLIKVWSDHGAIVGMNVGYDLTMVESLCQRLGLATLVERGGPGPVVDILVVDRHYDKWRKGKRTLGDLCRHYDVVLGDAHSAIADADASLAVFEAQRARYPEFAVLPLDELNTVQRSWYQEWLSSFSTYLEKKGEPPISRGRYEWPLHVNA